MPRYTPNEDEIVAGGHDMGLTGDEIGQCLMKAGFRYRTRQSIAARIIVLRALKVIDGYDDDPRIGDIKFCEAMQNAVDKGLENPYIGIREEVGPFTPRFYQPEPSRSMLGSPAGDCASAGDPHSHLFA